jgi:uncharacterized membrane protein YozB (DUF420 family)
VAILFILTVGWGFKRGHNYAKHGIIMEIAVALHTISIFVVMVPSLVASTGLFASLLNRLALTILPHSVLGSFVEILGIYLLSVWASNPSKYKACFKNKMIMKATVLLWAAELVLGIYIYILLYIPS